jgi:hypothetical protein
MRRYGARSSVPNTYRGSAVVEQGDDDRRRGDGARRWRSRAALETHGYPRTAAIKMVRPRASSGSLGSGSGEGQSRGKTRARKRKLLVGEQARRQSMRRAAGAHNHDGAACWKAQIEERIVLVSSLVWLQLGDGHAMLAPRQAIRKASMEKGRLFFIMK